MGRPPVWLPLVICGRRAVVNIYSPLLNVMTVTQPFRSMKTRNWQNWNRKQELISCWLYTQIIGASCVVALGTPPFPNLANLFHVHAFFISLNSANLVNHDKIQKQCSYYQHYLSGQSYIPNASNRKYIFFTVSKQYAGSNPEPKSVVDPGFPRGGGANSKCGCCMKLKEFRPGGHVRQ